MSQYVSVWACRLFITHMHGDHCFGISGVLRAIDAALRARGPEGAARPDPVYIYGPPGVAYPPSKAEP